MLTCGVCRRQFTSGGGGGGGDGSAEAVCGDCKFLLLEDQGSSVRRAPGRRRRGSLESVNSWPSDTPGSFREDEQYPSSRNSGHGSSESGSMRWQFVSSDMDTDSSIFCDYLESYSSSTSLDGSTSRSVLAGGGYSDQCDLLDFVSTPSSGSDSDMDPMNANHQWHSYPEEDNQTARFVTRMVIPEGCGMVCVICREGFRAGEGADSLPCCHVYHQSCISEWLRASNSCPLCRYDLPAGNNGGGEPPSVEENGGETSGEVSWRRWLLLRLSTAAAPILSMSAVGIVIVLSIKRRPEAGACVRAGKKGGVWRSFW